MDESNIDWTVKFATNAEYSIFPLLKSSKTQKFTQIMSDSATFVATFDEYSVADCPEIFIVATLVMNGNTEKRYFDCIKMSTGWEMVREMRGPSMPFEISINNTEISNTGYLVLNVEGTGTGNETGTVTLMAASNTAN